LRKTLRSKYRIAFNTFDLAYADYWQKTRPDTALSKDTFPFWEEGAIVADLASILGDAPFVGWIPKLAKVAGKGSRLLGEWWSKRGHQELRALPALEATEVAARLPMFWAADLKAYLATRDARSVLFLDTYEALTGSGRSKDRLLLEDAWVRELVSQLPEVLWVVCGREKLRWDVAEPEWKDCFHQYLVGGLSEDDARRFLTGCGAQNPAVQTAIYEGSGGLPYYLDLAVDTFLAIEQANKRQPEPSDFARAPTEVFARLLRHLTQPEVETLRVLSVPRFWDRRLFELLVTTFQTGYPVSAFADLCWFSFIDADAAAGTWTMHRLMRDSLQGHLDEELTTRIHGVLFDHYAGQVKNMEARDIRLDHCVKLTEAFHHGRHAVQAEALFVWFIGAADVFKQATCFTTLVPLCREVTALLQEKLGHENLDVARSLSYLADLLRALGKYAEAEPLYGRALAIREAKLGSDHHDVAVSLGNLASLMRDQGRYAEAEPLYRRALAILELTPGNTHPEVAVCHLNDLAVLLCDQGKYAEAEPLYRRALKVDEEVYGSDHSETAIDLNNLAAVLRVLGGYTEAELLLRRALAIQERQMGPDHVDVASPLNELAALLHTQRRYDDAEPLYRRALSIWEARLGPNHPVLATFLNNIAVLECDRGRYADAEHLHSRALAIREENLGADHPYVAVSLHNMAVLMCKQGRHAAAEPLLRRALTIREAKLGPDNPDVAKSLERLAEIYTAMGRAELAQSCATRAESIRLKQRP
jgi:tetratricopeptide (TPR) repeat protein